MLDEKLVNDTILRTCSQYRSKRLDEIIQKKLTPDELLRTAGRATASKELEIMLRNALGLSAP